MKAPAHKPSLVIDLTASPKKNDGETEMLFKLRYAMATSVTHEELQSAILKMFKRLPEAIDMLHQTLVPRPSASATKATSKRKRNGCEFCGECGDDSDAYCKSRRMKRSKYATLLSVLSYSIKC